MTNPPTIFVSFLLLLSLPILFTTRVTSYSPVEVFAVNCGSSSKLPPTLDRRKWTGDVNFKLFSPIEPQTDHPSVTAEAPRQSLSVNEVPYGTARLSLSEFTYSFPVTDGQKFIRLHFNPAPYLNFDRSNFLFSVKAGPFTLLKDFNASLISDNGDDPAETIYKEYVVNVEPGHRLNVTFIPSPTNPNAYAFINGIEVVSSPTDLYFTKPNNLRGLPLNGGNYPFQVGNNSALETAYRINVGWLQIPADKDTGMFRLWDDDGPYVKIQRPQSIPVGFGLKPVYKDSLNPNYTAPFEVYLTARTYGKNETSKYNVTWEFEVDLEFTYMVRLHFCEFEQEIQTTGGRVFQIFIADTLVEPHADVIMWSGENLVPVYKDYAVSMFSKDSLKKKLNLSIKLQPHPNPRVSSYNNVILNGIEVLKISDESNNLAGPNPSPPPSPSHPFLPLTKTSKKLKKTTVISTVVGVGSGFILLSLIVLLVFRRLTKADPVNHGKKSTSKTSRTRGSLLPSDLGTSKISKTYGPLSRSDLCRRFSIAEIKVATKNFNNNFIVGVGGFGNVYKGYINKSTTPVAIKRLKPGSKQGVHEFQTEIEMLSELRHLHLVSLIGYCNDGQEMILVYDFMANGTFRDHLYNSENNPLSWKQRLKICLGAARGLHYLHTGAKYKIIHRDVKTTNILIDDKWVAKVSDFGLSKPTGISETHVSTIVKGSIGYLDPEYYRRQRLTHKSDVYSFGVVLLEVLCGKPPILRIVDEQHESLVEWVRRCHHDGKIDQTVDPFLKESITPECLKAFTEMTLNCLVDDGNQRPSMGDVMWGLEFALELSESSEETRLSGTQNEEENAAGNSNGEDQILVSGMVSSVFSELRDLPAR